MDLGENCIKYLINNSDSAGSLPENWRHSGTFQLFYKLMWSWHQSLGGNRAERRRKKTIGYILSWIYLQGSLGEGRKNGET